MADNLITFMCLLSRNTGRLTFLDPCELPRPVMGYLYFSGILPISIVALKISSISDFLLKSHIIIVLRFLGK
jgi:hypothetical protein